MRDASKASNMANGTRRLALLSGALVVLIWSGWIVFSRLGVHTRLTPADITLLRYVTAALCTLPWALRYPWRQLPLGRALVVALGCGFPYTLFSFYGLQLSPAANAGVLVNGSLPVVSGLLAIVVLKQRFSTGAWLGVGLVVVANAMMVWPVAGPLSLSVSGSLLLFCAAWVMAIYMTAIKYWGVTTREILVWVPWLNALMFAPLWWWLPHSLSAAELKDIGLQVVYQGLVVSVLALFLMGFTIRQLGAMASAVLMAFVPATTALLAIPVLGEWPLTAQWLAIGVCSIGILLYGWAQRQKQVTEPHVPEPNAVRG